jgi:hypothetical protein
MTSVNYRGWTWTEEAAAPDLDSPRGQAVSARATALMNEWSELRHDIEQEGFRRARYYDGDEYDEGYDPRNCECDEGRDSDPDELCVHDRKSLERVEESERVRVAGRQLRLDLIEAELDGLGARPMRTYEHWAEDEAYMRYMECERFGDYPD